MPRFLRLGNEMIHVPSLSSATIGTTCFGRPMLTLSFHATKTVVRVAYRNWDNCQNDFNRVKDALNEVEALLNKVPLTEPELKAVDPVVEQNMIKVKESIDAMDATLKEVFLNKATLTEPGLALVDPVVEQNMIKVKESIDAMDATLKETAQEKPL